MNNPSFLSAIELAQLIKQKDVSPTEVLENSYQNAKKWNSELNFMRAFFLQQGQNLLQSSNPNTPLYGVPFLLKDLLAELSGTPLEEGSAAFKGKISSTNSHLVDRYLGMGLIPFGKTATPEFGIMGTTEPQAYGPTRNPWDKNRSTGGSSGGSAVAVALGAVPIASGGDGGGSIRIPASACGIFGLKPTRGRTSNFPLGDLWSGATVQHILSRTVADSALVLDLSNGGMPGDGHLLPPPNLPYLGLKDIPQRQLTIAYSTQHPLGMTVDEECKTAVLKTVQLLTELGHRVVETGPTISGSELARNYLIIVAAHVTEHTRQITRQFGTQQLRKLELQTRTLAEVGESLSAGDYVEAKEHWKNYGHKMAEFHRQFDLYLTPTMAKLPPTIGTLAPSFAEKILMKSVIGLGAGKLLIKSGALDDLAQKSLEVVPFTQLANLTGAPAMSIPLHWTENSIPVGVQFMAPFGDENTLFHLAFELERSRPWQHHYHRLWQSFNYN